MRTSDQTAENGRVLSAQPVPLRQLGSTSLELSVIGFGASPLGDVFGQTNPAESIAAVHYAIERGINFFDVSPYYGLTLAETRLGEALVGRRDRVVLATKGGRNGTEQFDFSATAITRSVEDSLRRLQTEYVDLLQVHDTEFGSVDQIVNETLPAMRELQRQGKVRYIGITGYSLANLKAIASRAPVDSLLTYCRFNLMTSAIDQAFIPFAQQHHLGVINASPLHMGLLTQEGAPSWHPASAEVKAASRKVVELCLDHGVNTPELALRFCLDHPYISSTLIGMSTRRHVDANLQALTRSSNAELLEAIRRIVAPVGNATWPSGREENYG